MMWACSLCVLPGYFENIYILSVEEKSTVVLVEYVYTMASYINVHVRDRDIWSRSGKYEIIWRTMWRGYMVKGAVEERG